jgi:hypothetical protein
MRRPISIQFLAISFFVLSGICQAASETIKLNISPRMNAASESAKLNQCVETTRCEEFDFVAEMESGKIVGAYFFDPLVTFSNRIDFNADEINGISLFKDSYNRYWLKEMRYSDRLMKWTMDHLFFSFCNQQATSLKPFLNTLNFDVNFLGEEKLSSYSNCSEFSGRRKASSGEEDFVAEYQIEQKKYQPIP